MQTNTFMSKSELAALARSQGWMPAGNTIVVREAAANVSQNLGLEYPIEVTLAPDHVQFEASVVKVSKLRQFLERVMVGRSVDMFLLEQHAGTPFVRFEIRKNDVYGVSRFYGPKSEPEYIKYVIRDLARECQRLRQMIDGN